MFDVSSGCPRLSTTTAPRAFSFFTAIQPRVQPAGTSKSNKTDSGGAEEETPISIGNIFFSGVCKILSQSEFVWFSFEFKNRISYC
jgi:hypothetical protein